MQILPAHRDPKKMAQVAYHDWIIVCPQYTG